MHPGLKTPTVPTRVDSLNHVAGTAVRLCRSALRKGEYEMTQPSSAERGTELLKALEQVAKEFEADLPDTDYQYDLERERNG